MADGTVDFDPVVDIQVDGNGSVEELDGIVIIEEEPPREDGDVVVVGYEGALVQALPELARLAAAAWLRGAAWSAETGLRAGARIIRASVDAHAAGELAHEVGEGMRAYARELLGVSELEERVRALTVTDRFAAAERAGDPALVLRTQAGELLRQSADVHTDDDLHPAFGRILGELAPDEARILRLLSSEGPQPVVDVRAANLIGVGSQLVAPNLNMVAMQAGCRHGGRLAAYLGNLQRLGLVRFSDEPIDDAIAYQVLEAQPHVLAAIKETARAKSVQRSLALTEFGVEFCRAVLPADGSTGEAGATPPSGSR